jgi:hypothetical protein
MSICERIFCSEDWSNFDYSFEITTDSHLLIKLGTLSETCRPIEVFEGENFTTSFRWASL